jgi:hypothetical protein
MGSGESGCAGFDDQSEVNNKFRAGCSAFAMQKITSRHKLHRRQITDLCFNCCQTKQEIHLYSSARDYAGGKGYVNVQTEI